MNLGNIRYHPLRGYFTYNEIAPIFGHQIHHLIPMRFVNRFGMGTKYNTPVMRLDIETHKAFHQALNSRIGHTNHNTLLNTSNVTESQMYHYLEESYAEIGRLDLVNHINNWRRLKGI